MLKKERIKNIQKIRTSIKKDFPYLYEYMKYDKSYTFCDIYKFDNENNDYLKNIQVFLNENRETILKIIKKIVITDKNIDKYEYEKIRQNFNDVLYVFTSNDVDINNVYNIFKDVFFNDNIEIVMI